MGLGGAELGGGVHRGRLRGRSLSSAESPRERRQGPASHLWGFTAATKPCQGVKGFKESGRDRYVSDDEFRSVWEKADQTTRDAMDLALLTGQRPADVLKIERSEIHDGALWIVQNKTKAKRAIEITGELAQLIERINARPRQRLSAYLIQDDDGRHPGCPRAALTL